MSFGSGFSTLRSFCAARRTIRFSDRAPSMARIDISRPTKSGRIMYGKTTTSRIGRSGSRAGISAGCSSDGLIISSFSGSVSGSFFGTSCLLRVGQGLSVRRYDRNGGPSSEFLRANSTVAIRKPSLSPASYRFPSNS